MFFWWCFVLWVGGDDWVFFLVSFIIVWGFFYLMSWGFLGTFSLIYDKFGGINLWAWVCMYHRLCELKCCTIQFMPPQHPPQQNAFHPPWLFPSKCEMMVSICSAADRMFCDFCMSNCTGWSNEIPSFVLERNQWDCICIAYKMNHVSEITLPTSHFVS